MGVFGKNINNPIEALKVYFEADIGSSWCCALSKGKPKYSDQCTTDEKSANKDACETDTSSDKESECKWSDCSSVGYCQWDGILGRSTKEKRTCSGYTNEVDCNQGNGGRSGCEWQRGPTPQWYQLDEDNADLDDLVEEEENAMDEFEGFEEEEFVAMDDEMLNVNENVSINWIFVSFLSLFLMIFMYGIRQWTKVEGDKDGNFKNEYTPMIQI